MRLNWGLQAKRRLNLTDLSHNLLMVSLELRINNKESVLTILQEILKWSQELPAWQSDAIARLLGKQVLTTEDFDDLYALLKVAHGIPDHAGRTPKPLTADQIPAPVKTSTNV